MIMDILNQLLIFVTLCCLTQCLTAQWSTPRRQIIPRRLPDWLSGLHYDINPTWKRDNRDYQCDLEGCYWAEYQEGIHWGYYSTTNGDCDDCRDWCDHDMFCGAVECGYGYCSWWKIGTCKVGDLQLDVETCRKPDPYQCNLEGCYWNDYLEGIHWGYYSTTNGDCADCFDWCDDDMSCGAVECGHDYCSWWKVGTCKIGDAQLEFETCRKVDTYPDLECADGGILPNDEQCNDNYRCLAWANAGECHKNPNYMLQCCRKSCGMCEYEGTRTYQY